MVLNLSTPEVNSKISDDESISILISSFKPFVGVRKFNRYKQKRPKMDASIIKFFDSALSHTRRSDASSLDKFRVLACIG